ncbi:nuclear transport factor 2 family protein [Tumidithrix helvetica PCC 7403]|uniref:YybH family protein n=1 Tax=Tumidithrix helvetica TaxID=3457545 RepID=UPI003CBB04B5
MLKQVALLLITASLTTVAPLFSSAVSAEPTRQAQPSQIAQADRLAPPELKSVVTGLDAAANKRDINAVMQFYASNFSHSDGLTRDQLKEFLQELWQRYAQLKYSTEIVKWEQQGDKIVAETVTQIDGVKSKKDGDFKITASLASSQVYQKVNGKWQVVSQTILSEKSSMTSGSEPPKVELRVPDQIGVGRQYALDAIVIEPLGNNLLLGAAVEEAVNARNYMKDATIDLEPLRAGGVFKIGQAPFKEGDRWISVVLVRETGITIESQRLRVSTNFTGNQYTPLPEYGTTPSRVRPNPNDRSSS